MDSQSSFVVSLSGLLLNMANTVKHVNINCVIPLAIVAFHSLVVWVSWRRMQCFLYITSCPPRAQLNKADQSVSPRVYVQPNHRKDYTDKSAMPLPMLRNPSVHESRHFPLLLILTFHSCFLIMYFKAASTPNNDNACSIPCVNISCCLLCPIKS